jgi:hypothetical protein
VYAAIHRDVFAKESNTWSDTKVFGIACKRVKA